MNWNYQNQFQTSGWSHYSGAQYDVAAIDQQETDTQITFIILIICNDEQYVRMISSTFDQNFF